MTHEAHIEEETRPSLIELALTPLVLLCLWLQRFARWTVTLKQARKAQLANCIPAEHWPGLRKCEWLMAQTLAGGARQLLAGEDLDFDAILAVEEPPEHYGGPCPRDAWEMNRRFAALAAFHADPASAVRRHAARIIAREGARDPFGNVTAPATEAPDDPCVRIDPYPLSPPIRVIAPAQRVRAPP
jgi:hypothetical protein